MVGVILDTNIYGKIIEDKKDSLELVRAIKMDRQNFVIHNFKIIRDELRKAPAPKILPLYDELTSKNVIKPDKKMEKLADLYLKEYRANGGMQKKNNNFMNDLKIVACASQKGFNLIFSDDKKSMHSPIAMKSYQTINLKFNHRTPTFYWYKDLKKKYLN